MTLDLFERVIGAWEEEKLVYRQVFALAHRLTGFVGKPISTKNIADYVERTGKKSVILSFEDLENTREEGPEFSLSPVYRIPERKYSIRIRAFDIIPPNEFALGMYMEQARNEIESRGLTYFEDTDNIEDYLKRAQEKNANKEAKIIDIESYLKRKSQIDKEVENGS